MGIMHDFGRCTLLYDDYNTGKFKLGHTFQIISIAYNNFILFANEIYHSEYKMMYSAGGYYSQFGDEITSKIFYIELKEARFYFGLSSKGIYLDNYLKRHNINAEDDEMYLFAELRVNVNSTFTYPHFNIMTLKRDISIKEYYEYFNKNLEICKKFLPL
jgi:hypothetical protein